MQITNLFQQACAPRGEYGEKKSEGLQVGCSPKINQLIGSMNRPLIDVIANRGCPLRY